MSDAPDGVTLIGLKYAELLGRPLSKSLYRQLPHHKDTCCVNLDDSHEALCWEPALTLQGKINWCPPECEAETHCVCESDEQCRARKDPRCRRQREHQHLLLSMNGTLCQGFIYTRFMEYDDELPLRDSLCELMTPLEEEQDRLRQAQRARRSDGRTRPVVERLAEQKAYGEGEARLAVIEKTLKTYNYTRRRDLHAWLDQALAALPVILLRG